MIQVSEKSNSIRDHVKNIFFDRFRQQSRWFLAEFIVIVAGVLIALGIDEWRERNQEYELEEQYLMQIVTDLRATEEQQATANSDNAPFRDAANALRAAFESDTYPEKEKIRVWLTEMRYLGWPDPIVATLESMVLTGDLRLVRDPNVRSQMTEYLSYARDSWQVPINQRVERHRELHFQIMLLAQVHGISPSYWNGPYRASTDGGEIQDVAAFLADPRAYIYVASFAENRDIFVGYRQTLIDKARLLREALETYVSAN